MTSQHVFDAPSVSRNHFEVYSVCFEESAEPLVFVRDRQSTKGTFVNDTLIGNKTVINAGRLLEDGDLITIKPGVSLKVKLWAKDRVALTDVQQKETALFADEYEVTNRILGEGSYACVRLAVDRKTGAQVACKVYDMEKLAKTGKNATKELLLKPITISSQLEHPNMASFLRAYTTPHNIYIMEELAAGGDLFALQSRRDLFHEGEVRWMTYQLLQAVDYLHQKGVVHRDIKPENILCMTCPDTNHRIALTDFGHADLLAGVGTLATKAGTSGYQAPEMLGKGAAYNQSADMWSVGITTATLLGTTSLLDSLETLGEKVKHAAAASASPSASASVPLETLKIDPIFIELKVVRAKYSGLSEQGCDFLRGCLQVDPRKRLSAREALKHPWLLDEEKTVGVRESFESNARRIRGAWVGRQVLPEMVTQLPDVGDQVKARKKKSVMTRTRSLTPPSVMPGLSPKGSWGKRKRTQEVEEVEEEKQEVQEEEGRGESGVKRIKR